MIKLQLVTEHIHNAPFQVRVRFIVEGQNLYTNKTIIGGINTGLIQWSYIQEIFNYYNLPWWKRIFSKRPSISVEIITDSEYKRQYK